MKYFKMYCYIEYLGYYYISTVLKFYSFKIKSWCFAISLNFPKNIILNDSKSFLAII